MSKRKPPNYWTKERCHEEALNYEVRKAFQIGSKSAYKAAYSKGWMSDICSHMKSPPKQKEKGYWTKERCANEALEYETRTAFQKGAQGAYLAARKNKWLNDICGHMKCIKKPDGYWTKERCHEQALNYEVREAFRIGSKGAYDAALRHGWLDEICSHMETPFVWTFDKCAEEALQHNSKTLFKNSAGGAYRAARKNGWLDKICGHMETPFVWTKELILEEAIKYTSKTDFKQQSSGAYMAAKKLGCFDECCALMLERFTWTRETIFETAKQCKSLKQFREKHSGAYKAVKRLGYDLEVAALFGKKEQPSYLDREIRLDFVGKQKWSFDDEWNFTSIEFTKEQVVEIATRFERRNDFIISEPDVFAAAHFNGWVDEVCANME